jgi:hypothetical protein
MNVDGIEPLIIKIAAGDANIQENFPALVEAAMNKDFVQERHEQLSDGFEKGNNATIRRDGNISGLEDKLSRWNPKTPQKNLLSTTAQHSSFGEQR